MNEQRRKEIISRLVETSTEFRSLWEEHLDLERKLDEHRKHLHFQPEEELEIHKLKKLKLKGKDRIEQLISAATQM
jgi:hypothetical protein